MGFFSRFKRDVNQIRNKETMEAVVAACLLVSAADGQIEKSEIQKMEGIINNTSQLAAFKGKAIKETISRFQGILEEDFGLGKRRMLKEIEQVAENDETCEEIMYMTIAIAKSDGEIEPEEEKVLGELSKLLGQDLKEYGLSIA